MKNYFSNWFSLIQKRGNQFKKWKSTKNEEISLKNEKSFFKLIFMYSKKGEIILKSEKQQNYKDILSSHKGTS